VVDMCLASLCVCWTDAYRGSCWDSKTCGYKAGCLRVSFDHHVLHLITHTLEAQLGHALALAQVHTTGERTGRWPELGVGDSCDGGRQSEFCLQVCQLRPRLVWKPGVSSLVANIT